MELRMLTIYVMEHCRGCERALLYASEVRRRMPGVEVEVINLSNGDAPPDDIVGVPAYVLDDRIISHGNPHLDTLIDVIAATYGRSDA